MSDNFRTLNDDVASEKVSVLMNNLPRDVEISAIEKKLALIIPDTNFRVVSKKKNKPNCRSRGFAFIYFDTKQQAEQFLSKDYYYDGQFLNCKIIEKDDLYIKENTNLLRYPVKVLVDGLTEEMNADEIKSLLSSFGKVVEVDFDCKEVDFTNPVYVTFSNTSEAQSCVQAGSKFLLKENTEFKFYFARPKFSNYMLKKLNPIMGSYIKKIKHNLMRFYPEDFLSVEDKIQVIERHCSVRD